MTPTARQLATEETRRRVLGAARHVFATRGYAGASMRQIATAAELTAMALYTYASSKADLFGLVYEDGINRIYGEFDAVTAGRDSLVDEVEAVLVRGGELVLAVPDLLQFTMRVATDARHEELQHLDLVARPYVTFFERLTQRAIARGELAGEREARMAELVTMLLWGITTAASIDPAHVERAVATSIWTARACLSS